MLFPCLQELTRFLKKDVLSLKVLLQTLNSLVYFLFTAIT